MRVLLVDNYDSFTFNLAQALAALGAAVTVLRNDALPPRDLLAAAPHGLVLSPGPGRPADAGICPALLSTLLETRSQLPVLGVCLGHQAMAEAVGARVVRAQRPIHGQLWDVLPTPETTGAARAAPDPFFADVRWPLQATRYHSLLVDPATVPESLAITARTPEGEIMALRHRHLPWWGVQFHPESIGCPQGPTLLRNFLRLCRPQKRPADPKISDGD